MRLDRPSRCRAAGPGRLGHALCVPSPLVTDPPRPSYRSRGFRARPWGDSHRGGSAHPARMNRKHNLDRRPRAGWRRGVIATALAALIAPAVARAIVVPDDAPTIQAGIDSGSDTVLVRPGFYPETITIDHVMGLRGLPSASGELPELMGLILDDTHQGSSHSAYLEISDLHFRGQVRNVFHLALFSGPYHLDFTN